MPETPLPPVDLPPADSSAAPSLPERAPARTVAAIALSQFALSVPSVSMILLSWPHVVGLLEPDDKAFYLSLLSGLFAVVGVVVGPVVGVLSDYCTSRLGMRRPFLIIGALLGVAAMMLMGTATSITTLIAGALLYAAAAGIYTGGHAALVPDQIPAAGRGRVMGLVQIMTVLAGLVASVVLPSFMEQRFLLFALPGAVMALGATVAVLSIQDRHLDPAEARERPSLLAVFKQFKVNPRTIPDYSWAWTGKAITTLGTVLTTVYSYYFLTDHLKISAEDLPGVISLTGVIGLATAMLGAGLGSWISDRFKIRKRMVLYTSMMIMTGAVIAAFAPNVPVYLVALVIMGLGTGAYYPVDGAVMIDVLPGEGRETGKYMGLMTLADQVPRSVGPFIAAAVLGAGNMIPDGGYPAVFIAGGLIAIAGGLLIRKVKGSL